MDLDFVASRFGLAGVVEFVWFGCIICLSGLTSVLGLHNMPFWANFCLGVWILAMVWILGLDSGYCFWCFGVLLWF